MTDTAAPEAGGTTSGRARTAVVVGLLLGVFLAALDTMIMATALRTVADELQGLTLLAWVTTSYLITTTATAPLYGKVSDLYGRKKLYLAAIAVFIAGSLLCGLAQSVPQLAVARAVQGIGAGGLMSLAMAVLADLFPPETRAKHQANFGVVFGVASVAGPVLGGMFAGFDTVAGIAGWRWIFLINLPIGAVALFVVARYFTQPTSCAARKVDYWGSTMLLAAVVPLLLAVEQGSRWGWTSPGVLSCLALSTAGLVGLLAVERRQGDDALLPPRLFRGREFSLVNLVNFIGGMGVFGALTLVPLYLQIVQGLSPTAAGLLLLPQSLATTLGARLCEPMRLRFGSVRVVLVAGLAVMCGSYFAFAAVDARTSLWLIGALVSVMGVGLGLFFQIVLVALQNSVEPKDIGVASGLYSFFRQVGGAIGAAAFLAVLFSLATGSIRDAAQTAASTPEFRTAAADPAVLADPASRAFVTDLLAGGSGVDLDDTSVLKRLHPDLARPVLDGMSDALSTVFLIMAAVALVAVLLSLAVRPARQQPEPSPGGRQ